MMLHLTAMCHLWMSQIGELILCSEWNGRAESSVTRSQSMQAGPGLYFDGHNMWQITSKDRLRSCNYVKGEGCKCNGTGQVHREAERWGTGFKYNCTEKKWRNKQREKRLQIWKCKAINCKMKIWPFINPMYFIPSINKCIKIKAFMRTLNAKLFLRTPTTHNC